MGKPIAISAVIHQIMSAIEKPQEQAQTTLLRRWHEIISPAAAAHAAPFQITRGVLLVHVDHAAWVHELTMRKAEIITRLQKIIPRGAIQDIRFTIGTPHPEKARQSAGVAPEEPKEKK